jgi:cell wall-associated NlpC family hydrolase
MIKAHPFNTWPDFWNDDLENQFYALALKNYPKEAIAILTKVGLQELENTSEDPESEYISFIEPESYSEIVAIIHSHPDADTRPSKIDCETQLALSVPSGIVSVSEGAVGVSMWAGDHTLSKELEERPFYHVYYDCYSLIRAYFYQKRGVLLKDYPREDDWWYAGEDMYEQLFIDAGFEEINTSEGLEQGDIIFMKINANVSNHAAIYIDDNLILHHMNGRLSRVDNYSTWAKLVSKIVRFKK